jgi:hypothetical protein
MQGDMYRFLHEHNFIIALKIFRHWLAIVVLGLCLQQ